MKLLNLGCGTRYHPAWINLDLESTGPGVIPCDLRNGLPFTDNSFDVVYHSHLLEHLSKNYAVVFLRKCLRVLRTGGIIRVVVPDLEQTVKTYLKILEEIEEGNEEAHEHYHWVIIELLDQMVRNETGGEMLKYWKQDPMPAENFVFERVGSELLSHLSISRNTDRSVSTFESDKGLNQEFNLDAAEIGKFRMSGEIHQWMYDRYSLRGLLEKVGFRQVQLCRADESSIPNFNTYLLDIDENGLRYKPGSLYMEARRTDEFAKEILERRKKNSAELRADKDKYDTLISKSRPNKSKYLLHEIRKRNEQLAEVRQDLDMAIEEIRKRDEKLAEVRQDLDMVIEEIRKRNEELAQLQQFSEQILAKLPLVSIVTPVFNGEKWIDSCIRSVSNQDYPKIDHIIVDGGSTDGTLEICQRYAHLIVHSHRDRGQSHAINKGFAMAQGDILAWLCADDDYEPGAVSAAVKGIMAGHNVIMGLSRYVDAGGHIIADHPANVFPYYDHNMFLRFWKYSTISQPAVFWTRNMWDTCGPLKENLYFAMDYDLWLRMTQRSNFERINTYTSRYCIHPEAKCFIDNYGSRIELIQVSRKFWPTKWRLRFWKLHLSYLFSNSPVTQHFYDGQILLQETINCLDNSLRLKAIFLFAKAHYKHFATPYLPGYKLVLKRILKEGIGPAWSWRLGKKIWYFLRRKKI